MTNQETTLVPIRKRFDEEGRPSCGGCPMNICAVFPAPPRPIDCNVCSPDWDVEGTITPGPDCPVHNPREGMEAL